MFLFTKICITAISSCFAYVIAEKIGLFKPSIFIMISCFSVYMTISSVENILFSACESILVCVREDSQRNGTEKSHTPTSLWEVSNMFTNTAEQSTV